MPQDRTDFVVVIFIVVAVGALLVHSGNLLWHGPGPEPEILSFEDDDEEMNSAMRQARENVQPLLTALDELTPSQSHLSVKVGFRDENGTEYMWLNDVRYQDGYFHGMVANEPATVNSVGYGDAVKVKREEIADWMFIDEGKLVGGYTIRVMRNRLSPEKRMELDANVGFAID